MIENYTANSKFQEDCCIICKLGFEGKKPVIVTSKGILTLIKYSEEHGENDLREYLTRCLNPPHTKSVLVHENCRKDFTKRSHSSVQHDNAPSAKKLRSSLPPFNWKKECILCGKIATFDTRHPERSQVHKICTLPIKDRLLECCQRRGDSWGLEVQERLHGCFDLVAEEAVYHSHCYSRFMLNKQIGKSNSKKDVGRPQDQEMLQSFEDLCHWLELQGGTDLYTLSELHEKMEELASGSEVYTIKRLKQELLDHYKDAIFFAEVEGRHNVICFRNMAKHIINEKWYSERKDNVEEETEHIIKTAARLIQAQIREVEYDLGSYPSNDEINNINNCGRTKVPQLLQTFLKTIISIELKQISIGQCIVQAARPRSVMMPILFGLGVEIDHIFGSKWLITQLSRLGFSISYDEVVRYKQSVIQSENPDNLLAEYLPGTFTQWVADNVDHNLATLDGQETFHGMGIIAVSTPQDHQVFHSASRIIRRQNIVKVHELVKDKGVSIVQYKGSIKKGLASLTFKPIIELQLPYTLPQELCSDTLWHSGWMFSGAVKPRPNWSGFMQHIFSESDCPITKSEVLFLPIIDLNPSDETCIYSTLVYIQSQAEQLGIPTACITFDQPLWLKAVEIITERSLSIVCRLGGFHTMMSFLGSIGSMMKGSGLEEALEQVYGPNAVAHMMTGKAVSRALRGHFLVESALVNKLMLAIIPSKRIESEKMMDASDDTDMYADKHDEPGLCKDMCENETFTITLAGNEATDVDIAMRTDGSSDDQLSVGEIEKIHSLFDSVSSKTVPFTSVNTSEELIKLEKLLHRYKEFLAEKSPTARLWLQYLEYVNTLKIFIRAERIGDWNLHLIAIKKMLNLFAATGHINYAKSSQLYLQLMMQLPSDYPWLYQCFIEKGYHTIRRSSRFWAGLWTDLTIEQVMMRSIKSRGGLTSGRGLTESVRLQWVYSIHKCAAIHRSMTTLTGLNHDTSEQHVDLGTSRSNRDFHGLNNIQQWFDQHELFDLTEKRLRSLSSGLIAADDDCINCDKVEEIGARIQEQLDNLSIPDASIRRKDQIQALRHLYPAIRIDKQKVHFNPSILFTRLTAILQREEDIKPFFDYELAAIPTALFKDGFMRKPVKSQLAQFFTLNVQSANEPSIKPLQVIDGGALLHRVKWAKRAAYKDIVEQYVCYIQTKYGGSSCVVFDGYGYGPSTKDHEHQRRIRKTCADIHLNESMIAHNNQQVFLSNNKNKNQFVQLLSHYLRQDSQIVYNSTGDADTMIVKCALDFAAQGNEVTVVTDDTDILVL